MDLIMNAVSAVAQFFGDPPRLAAPNGISETTITITKREAIVMVTATATMYSFCPERLWICKAIFNIVLLGWVTALAFDAKEVGVEAWAGIPLWLKRYLGSGDGGAAGGSGGLRAVNLGSRSLKQTRGHLAVARVSEMIQKIKAAQLTQDLWEVVRRFLIRCLKMALHYLEPPGDLRHDQIHGASRNSPNSGAKTSLETPHNPRAPSTSREWYALLVRTPPAGDDEIFNTKTSFWDDDVDMWQQTEDAPELSSLPWNSTSTSCLPTFLDDSLSAETHFSFCIIEKSTWEASKITLVEKLSLGKYWNHRGENGYQRGKKWTDRDIRKIIAVEVLGMVQPDKGRDVFDLCHEHFDTLRSLWGEYRTISWNDIDFAIFLGLLTTGPEAAQISKQLFQTMGTVRLEQILVPRAQLASGLLTVVGAAAVIGTGGLAAPFVGPMVLGRFGAEGAKIRKRDQVIWDERVDMLKGLSEKFPQLGVLLDG